MAPACLTLFDLEPSGPLALAFTSSTFSHPQWTLEGHLCHTGAECCNCKQLGRYYTLSHSPPPPLSNFSTVTTDS